MVWCWVPGYEGRYEVSDAGGVRSWVRSGVRPRPRTSPKILVPVRDRYAWVGIRACDERKWRRRAVHDLVLAAFVGPKPPGKVCHHRNSNGLDNRLENLCYVTPKVNLRAAKWPAGVSPRPIGDLLTAIPTVPMNPAGHCTPEERWQPIPWASEYEVSDRGRVRSWLVPGHPQRRKAAEPHILQPMKNQDGYLKVTIPRPAGGRGPAPIHKLVLHLFAESNPTESTITRHLDGQKNNNRIDNLAYGTELENAVDALRHGQVRCGSSHYRARLSVQDVRFLRTEMARRFSYAELAKKYDVSRSTIACAVRGRSWRCVGM